MKQWWQNLAPREQLILILGASLGFIILFYLFIWSPLTSSIANNQNYVAYQQSLLTWMQQANIELQHLRSTGTELQKINADQLLTVIDTSIQEAKLKQYATSIQQSGVDKVLINFKQIPFDQFIAWLQNSWETHGIKVNQLSITPNQNIVGVVDAEVYLTS